jgi:predicted transcriptional regulator
MKIRITKTIEVDEKKWAKRFKIEESEVRKYLKTFLEAVIDDELRKQDRRHEPISNQAIKEYGGEIITMVKKDGGKLPWE